MGHPALPHYPALPARAPTNCPACRCAPAQVSLPWEAHDDGFSSCVTSKYPLLAHRTREKWGTPRSRTTRRSPPARPQTAQLVAALLRRSACPGKLTMMGLAVV